MRVDRHKLLVVEDDAILLQQLRWTLDEFELLPARNRMEAIGQLRAHAPPVALLDLGLPPDPRGVSVGFSLMEAMLDIAPATRIVVLTGQEARHHAVRAVGSGACDFHTKPVQPDVIRLVLQRAFHLTALEAEHRRTLLPALATPLPGVIAASPAMLQVCRMIERLAPTDIGIVLQGESGTGKEILARALHSLSGRRAGRFVAINCAAIPEALLEAELFGFERGAFTGAVKQTQGRLELAHGGTLLLDEIGDLPLGLQAKLLRFLQERVLERVGGRREIAVDVRVVCATHRNLEQLIRERLFREDLYYRLAEVTVAIPPLRERAGDAVLLARHLLDEHGRTLGLRPRQLTQTAVRVLDTYSWPGNVRELQNRLKRAVIMAEGPRIGPEDLGLPSPIEEAGRALDLRRVREEAEAATLQRALAQAAGNLSHAARLLGISRPTLYDLLRQHGLRD